MAPEKTSGLFRDPHSQLGHIGTLPIRVKFPVSENFPGTCAACSNLARTKDRDNNSLGKGTDDFTASFEKLLQILDVFIREKSKGIFSAGHKRNYSCADNEEFTLLLLWQVRHILTHNGAVIDKKCKKDYETIFSKKEEGIHPVIDLPETLDIGNEFMIRHQDYCQVRTCLFNYIRKRVPPKDFSIIAYRAVVTNFHLTGGVVQIRLAEGLLAVNIRMASELGIDINLKTGKLDTPDGASFSFEDSCIHLPDGRLLPAKFTRDAGFDNTALSELLNL